MSNAKVKIGPAMHSFSKGNIIMRLNGEGKLCQYFVSQVINSYSLKAILIDEKGLLTNLTITFEGDELNSLQQDPCANRLRDIIKELKNG